MSADSVLHKQNLESRELPLNTVTIFSDRAELKYVFGVILKQGLNNICVDNVCASIEADSIRVDGKGVATIHEVQYKTEHATDSEVDTPQVKEIVKQLEELELKKAGVEDLVKIYTNRMKSLDNIVQHLGEATISKKKSDELLKFDSQTEETLENFYGYHEKKAVDLNGKIRRSNLDIKELNQQIEKLKNNLNQLRYNVPVKRSICIFLEATVDNTETEVELTYQVYNASWTPAYDIRVNTLEKTPRLRLIYYGNIRQNMGEDWKDVNLILSTAKPRVGGQLPEIGTLEARFFKPPPSAFGNGNMPTQQAFFGAPRSAAKAQKQSFFGGTSSDETMNFALMEEPQPMMIPSEYKAESHVLSTTFSVPIKKTIPSDGSEHKVTIASLDLNPILHFDCVPSKNTNVYLNASMINSSQYPLLNGQASVYVDNSFSAKIHLKAVASGEKFDCSLGVDPTIKVQYKPVHKYQQQTGVISKSSVTIHEQKIVVKNTKQQEPIILTFVEHVPKSTDEKIKIKLHTPELKTVTTSGSQHSITSEELFKLKSPEAGTRLNDTHNLEWTVVLNPLEEKEFVLKYSVEHPPSEIIQYIERF